MILETVVDARTADDVATKVPAILVPCNVVDASEADDVPVMVPMVALPSEAMEAVRDWISCVMM